jgi:hypothetical protein
VARAAIAPELAGELERALREAIHYALERDIRSASFIDDVRRRSPRAAGRPAGPR